jgi:biotin transport system substrate-specific component
MNDTQQHTLRPWAAQQVVTDPRLQKAIGGLFFVLATALVAQFAVKIPAITPVPNSLQPLFVLLAGATLGPRAGALAMASYVLLGAAGAPVYALGRGGAMWLMGPTGGYLLSYPLAAFVVGLFVGREPRGLRLGIALFAGMATIYLGGLSQLWLLTHAQLGIVFAQSVVPFVVGDLLKIGVAWATVMGVRSARLGKTRS